MSEGELQRRWMAQEPVEGIGFLLNDPVRVLGGPHAGAEGSVIYLLEAGADPRYGVELSNGSDIDVTESALLPGLGGDIGESVGKLQRWYSSQCDGDWEHQLGVRIGTLDNPGWFVDIDLKDTPLDAPPTVIRIDLDPARSWIHCEVAEGQFRGRGGPHMLGAILTEFVRWAEAASSREGDGQGTGIGEVP